MRNCLLPIILVALGVTSYSCNSGTGEHDKDSNATPKNPYAFGDTGFTFIQMGDSLTWANITVPDGQVKDTIFEQISIDVEGDTSDFAWNVKIVTHPDGKVILESDFETFAFLGRAQIESPRYVNGEGIHVGSTVADLKAAYSDLIVKPFMAYKVYEIVHGRQIFHVPMETPVSDDTSITINQLPDNLKVIRIVLMVQ